MLMNRALFALLFLLPHTVLANVAAPQRRGATMVTYGDGGAAGLRAIREVLSFQCEDAADGSPRCRFVADYTLENASDATVSTYAAFYSERVSSLQATLDGKPVLSELTQEQQAALDQAVLAVTHEQSRVWRLVRHQSEPLRQGLSIVVEARRTARLVVEGWMEPETSFKPRGYLMSPIHTRHPFFGLPTYEGEHHTFEYWIAPIRTWGPAPRIELTVAWPSHWVFSTSPLMAHKNERGGVTTLVEELDASAVDTLSFVVNHPAPLVANGGPVVALGGNLDDSGGFRMRLGYEVAGPEWLVLSGSADFDLHGEWVLAPAAELATEDVMVIVPSLAVGLGVPVRVAPTVDVGIRGLATITWPLVGTVLSADWYPGMKSDNPDAFQLTLMARFGF